MTFKKFVGQLEDLGYKVEYRELVAADYGAPTMRKRFFLIARCDGGPITWPAPTHAPADSEDAKSGLLQPYVGAYTQIDFSLSCPFCGGEAYINCETITGICWAQILCKKCHCRSAGNWSNIYANAEKKEIEAWNTRKPMERIVEQLENEITATKTKCPVNVDFDIVLYKAIEIVKKGGVE